MLQSAIHQGRYNAAQMEATNQQRQANNQRIAALLKSTTQEDELEADPRQWWNWWKDYMDEHPELRVQAARSGASILRPAASGLYHRTLVWTSMGRRPIEEIRIGDLVLGQDPETGELSYNPVLGVARAVLPNRRVVFAESTLQAAEGLILWKAGDGWWQARDLKAGAAAHRVGGQSEVKDNVESVESPSYHLAVAGTHNFIVGVEGLLVHDVTAPTVKALRLPGLKSD